jgi:hypothetical protein
MSGILDALPTVDSPTTLLTPDSPGRFIYGSQPMVRQHPSPRGKTLPLPVVSVTPVRPVFSRRRTSDTGEKEREAEKIEAFSALGSVPGKRKVLLELDIVCGPLELEDEADDVLVCRCQHSLITVKDTTAYRLPFFFNPISCTHHHCAPFQTSSQGREFCYHIACCRRALASL